MFSLLPVVFFASGAAALVFEVVWFHLTGLVFGNSVWATSIVLASFMGGLGLGNHLVGRYGANVHRPIRAYAGLEVCIGLTGFLLTLLLPHLPRLLAPVFGPLLDSPWLVNPLRLALAFVLLLLPTTAMGATLPLLVAAACREGSGFGSALGRMYGFNTLGAVAGVLLVETVLVERLGIRGAAATAALTNLLASAAALQLARRFEDPRKRLSPAGKGMGVAPAPAGTSSSARAKGTGGPRAFLLAAFLAGAAMLALEVLWFRFLLLFVTNNTLALSIMLAVVLAGIAGGGLLASWRLRSATRPGASGAAPPGKATAAGGGHHGELGAGRSRSGAERMLPWTALAAAVCVILTYVAFQFGLEAAPFRWTAVLWMALRLILPVALVSGFLFTLQGEALRERSRADTEAAGQLTLANTLGAMIGSLCGGFVLLPLLGTERSFAALTLVYAAIALVLAPRGARRERVVAAAVAVVALLLVVFPFGFMTKTYIPRSVRQFTADGSKIVAVREGPIETSVLLRQDWLAQPVYHRLVTNGFTMSGTGIQAKRYMRLFAFMPAIVHAAPLRRALVISYGVGVTASAVRDLDSVQSIDVVDISRDIVELSDRLYTAENHPLHDPRVRLHLEDGRHFLQNTRTSYDLITGEPPPPRLPGTVNLYSREYFQLIHDRLAEGGMTTYWLPIPDLLVEDTLAIIRAFCEVFDNCTLWNGTPMDWMLVGFRGTPPATSAADFRRLWSDSRIGPQLREIGLETPEQLLATFIGDAVTWGQVTAKTAPLTDDRPKRLRTLYKEPPDTRLDFYLAAIDPGRGRQALARSALAKQLFPAEILQAAGPYFEVQQMVNLALTNPPSPLPHLNQIHMLLSKTALRTLPLWLLGSNETSLHIAAAAADDGTGAVDYVLGLGALVDRDYARAAARLARSRQRAWRPGLSGPLYAYALCMCGRLEDVKALRLQLRPPAADPVWRWLGETFAL